MSEVTTSGEELDVPPSEGTQADKGIVLGSVYVTDRETGDSKRISRFRARKDQELKIIFERIEGQTRVQLDEELVFYFDEQADTGGSSEMSGDRKGKEEAFEKAEKHLSDALVEHENRRPTVDDYYDDHTIPFDALSLQDKFTVFCDCLDNFKSKLGV